MVVTKQERDDTPALVIGMPVYNAAKYLGRALDSLLAQTFKDFSIVIFDNASTDGTPAICHAYTRADDRIEYRRNATNLGAIENFNRAFRTTTGEYFAWAAYDDLWEPEYFARCIELLHANPCAALAHSQVQRIFSSGGPFLDTYDGFAAEEESPELRFRKVVGDWRWAFTIYGVHRREILRRTRLLQPVYGSDLVLLGEISLLGKIVEVPMVLFRHQTSEKDEVETEYIERVRRSIFPNDPPYSYRRPYAHLGFFHLRTAFRAEVRPWKRLMLAADVLASYWWRNVLLRGVRSYLRRSRSSQCQT